MPGPPNTSSLTATIIPSLPYTITIDVEGAPGSHDVWWKYTATPQDEAVGSLAWADNAVAYRPRSTVWLGPASAPVAYLAGFQADRQATQVPVSAGTTYYWKVIDSNGTEPLGGPLTFSVYAAPPPTTTLPIGTLLITDDFSGGVQGYPAVALDPVTGAILRLPPLSVSEIGDVASTGQILLVSDADETIQYLYNPQLGLVQSFASIIPNTAYAQSVRTDGARTFFIGWSFTGGAGRDSVTTITADGVVGPTTWVLPNNMLSIAPSRDRTILYYASGIAGSPIYRFDLVGNAPLSNLVAGVAGYTVQKDLFVLADGTILAGYYKASPQDYNVLHYSAAGALLNTYAFGAETRNRLALWLDDPLSFLVWIDAPNAFSRIRRIRVSDGATLSDFSDQQFEAGVSQLVTPVSNPTFKYGPSESCPLLVLRVQVSPPVPAPPLPVPGLLKTGKMHVYGYAEQAVGTGPKLLAPSARIDIFNQDLPHHQGLGVKVESSQPLGNPFVADKNAYYSAYVVPEPIDLQDFGDGIDPVQRYMDFLALDPRVSVLQQSLLTLQQSMALLTADASGKVNQVRNVATGLPLGGSLTVGQLAPTFADVPNALPLRMATASLGTILATLVVTVRTDGSGGAVTPQLLNVTTGLVAALGVPMSSSTPTIQRIPCVLTGSTSEYHLQVMVSDGTTFVYGLGYLELQGLVS